MLHARKASVNLATEKTASLPTFFLAPVSQQEKVSAIEPTRCSESSTLAHAIHSAVEGRRHRSRNARGTCDAFEVTGEGEQEFSWRDLDAAGVRALDDVSCRAAAAIEDLLNGTELWLEAARPIFRQLGEMALQAQDAFDEGVPSGWGALTVPEMLEVTDLMRETGWCLTTSPPAETLKLLLQAANRDERCGLLLEAERQILQDLDLELRSAEDRELRAFAEAARQSWDAHASGLFLASQALSATVVGSLSDRRGPLAYRNLGAARAHLSGLTFEDVGLRGFRFVAVAGAAGTALATFPREGPEPALFNRHASAHGLSTVQFTQVNSLTALMLACGWLREVHWLLRAARAEVKTSETDHGTQRAGLA